jgi:hypothetical protein
MSKSTRKKAVEQFVCSLGAVLFVVFVIRYTAKANPLLGGAPKTGKFRPSFHSISVTLQATACR